MSDIDDSKPQRFLNSKLVPPGQLGEGGEGIMSQVEFDAFLKEASPKSVSSVLSGKYVVKLNVINLRKSVLITAATVNVPTFDDLHFLKAALDAAQEAYSYVLGGCIMYPGLGSPRNGILYKATFPYKGSKYVLDVFELFELAEEIFDVSSGLQLVQNLTATDVDRMSNVNHRISMCASSLII